MRFLVVYSSLTGNTKRLAEAVFSVMPEGTDFYSVEDAPSPDGYDFIGIGYWVYKGHADLKAKGYMERIEGKKVLPFGTLGAYPDSAHAERSRGRVRELLQEKNTVLSEFQCHGRIDPAITERQKNLPEGNSHRMTPERMKRHIAASTHPDENDFNNVKKIFKSILETLE